MKVMVILIVALAGTAERPSPRESVNRKAAEGAARSSHSGHREHVHVYHRSVPRRDSAYAQRDNVEKRRDASSRIN